MSFKLQSFNTNLVSLYYLVHDLAARFADGRLSTEKLLKATDEELSEMLIQIYGVGKVGPFLFYFVTHSSD